jgi:hypothetical protein
MDDTEFPAPFSPRGEGLGMRVSVCYCRVEAWFLVVLSPDLSVLAWIRVQPSPPAPIPVGEGSKDFGARGVMLGRYARGFGGGRCWCGVLLQWGVDLLGRKGH